MTHIKIGSGILTTDGLPDDRQKVIDNIKVNIEEIRASAKEYYSSFEREKEERNNVISIIGERGTGKTSILLTELKKLEEENKVENKCKDNPINMNIILPIIDPDRFNYESDALGWVIFSFQRLMDNYEKYFEKKTSDCKSTGFLKVKEKFTGLKEIYGKSKYNEAVLNLVSGISDYNKLNKDSIFADIRLYDEFYEFIDVFICLTGNNIPEGGFPLIFIPFDDIDLCPKQGIEILNIAKNYLAHPAVVVFITGDWDTFKESTVVNLMNKEEISSELYRYYEKIQRIGISIKNEEDNIINKNSLYGNDNSYKQNILLERILKRSEKFLEKAVPFYLRNELSVFSIRDRFNFIPYGNKEYYKNVTLEEKLKKWIIVKGNNNMEPFTILDCMRLPKFGIAEAENQTAVIWIESLFNSLKEDTPEFKNEIDRFWSRLKRNEQKIKILKEYYKNNFILNILPETPRALINVYNFISTKSSTDFGFEHSEKYTLVNAFNVIKEIYNCFLDQSNENVKKIVKVDSNNYEVIIDLEKIRVLFEGLKTENFSTLNNDFFIPVSKKPIMFFEKDGNSIELNSNSMAFIMFFFDITKLFLIGKNLSINNIIGENFLLIHRGVNISSPNFLYFMDLFMFREVIIILLSIITENTEGLTEKDIIDTSLVTYLLVYFNNLNSYSERKSYIEYENELRIKYKNGLVEQEIKSIFINEKDNIQRYLTNLAEKDLLNRFKTYILNNNISEEYKKEELYKAIKQATNNSGFANLSEQIKEEAELFFKGVLNRIDNFKKSISKSNFVEYFGPIILREIYRKYYRICEICIENNKRDRTIKIKELLKGTSIHKFDELLSELNFSIKNIDELDKETENFGKSLDEKLKVIKEKLKTKYGNYRKKYEKYYQWIIEKKISLTPEDNSKLSSLLLDLEFDDFILYDFYKDLEYKKETLEGKIKEANDKISFVDKLMVGSESSI